MNLDDLLTIDAILRLRSRYCRFLDDKDWPGVRSLISDDFKLELSLASGVPPIVGGDAIIAMLAGRFGDNETGHHCFTPDITLQHPNQATGIWIQESWLIVDGQERSRFKGFAHDQYRFDGQDWRISHVKLRARGEPIAR